MGITVASLEVGLDRNLTYLVRDDVTGEAALIDPAFEADRILRWAQSKNARVTHVLCTHTHLDHVEAVGAVCRACQASASVHALEASLLPSDVDRAAVRTHSGPSTTIEVGHATVTALHTPGHTPGGTTYLVEDHAFTGDVLFVGGCGRADLPGGDVDALHRSLHSVLLGLPPETVVLPGHDYGVRPRSTLWNEARENPFLRYAGDPDGFRRFRRAGGAK